MANQTRFSEDAPISVEPPEAKALSAANTGDMPARGTTTGIAGRALKMQNASAHVVETTWSQQRKKLQSQNNSLDLLKQYKEKPSILLRNKIVELNMGLVRMQARKWANQCNEPLEDLVNEGVKGLIKAIERFDLVSGNAFSSVAIPYISGAIQHYMRDKTWGTVRPPRRAVETYAAVTKTHRTAAQHGREMPLEEVAEGMGVSRERWRFVKEAREQKPVISLDEEPLQLAADGPEVEEDQTWVYDYLKNLPEPGYSCVVERVFGNLADEEIAKRHPNLSVTMVQLLIQQGLEQMRAEIVAAGRMG